MRRFLVRTYVEKRLAESHLTPGEDTAAIVKQTMVWPSLNDVLSEYDDLWRLFWEHDFGGIDEPLAWIPEGTPMRWKRIYAWSVLFHRRCLWQTGQIRLRLYERMHVRPVPEFQSIPFGQTGSLRALTVWSRSNDDDDDDAAAFRFLGYAGSLELGSPVRGFSLAKPLHELGMLNPLRQDVAVRVVHPAEALWSAVQMDRRLNNGMRHTMREAFQDLVSEDVAVHSSLVVLMGFSYPAALWAYCCVHMLGQYTTAEDWTRKDLDPADYDQALAVLNALPALPAILGRWYVGSQAAY